MVSRVVMLSWLLSLIGCSPHPDGRAIEDSIKPLTSDESRLIADMRGSTVADLRTRYSIAKDVDSVTLLQRVIQDGSFAQATDMMPLGIVWGELVCRESGAEWVTAEWDGTRMFALNVPNTTIILFPIAMLEKRRDREETVDFPLFLTNTVDAMAKMKADPEYQR